MATGHFEKKFHSFVGTVFISSRIQNLISNFQNFTFKKCLPKILEQYVTAPFLTNSHREMFVLNNKNL